MRSCAYCGRDLQDGEQCNCPGAVARRENKKNNTNSYANKNHNDNRTSYHTGYTQKENPLKRAWKKNRMKAAARRNAYKSKNNYTNTPMDQGFWKNLWKFIAKFVVSPIETIANPGYINKGTVLVLAGIQGAIINLCIYFLRTGAVRSPFGIALSLITFNPMRSYSNLMYIGLAILSGIISGILIFFIYSGIFYFLNRFIMRQRTLFWDFSQRLVLTPIPFTAISVLGILFGMISSTTLAIMVLIGLVSMIILTYEALKTEWISFSNSRVFYMTILGLFIFTSIICYIIRLS